MLPYDVGAVAEERRAELLRTSQAGATARRARQAYRAQRDVGGWRRAASRALVTLAVRVGVSGPQRETVRQRAQDLLGAHQSC